MIKTAFAICNSEARFDHELTLNWLEICEVKILESLNFWSYVNVIFFMDQFPRSQFLSVKFSSFLDAWINPTIQLQKEEDADKTSPPWGHHETDDFRRMQLRYMRDDDRATLSAQDS
ncbi:uncharacterized protein [Oscarella lobularis]|uniref:uncharacterized protein n=1 Tax=Oscarella lobularis TaxID=121494 RepID=UPI00331422C5